MDTVLVIEDSRAMQRTLQRLFEADSLMVQIASDGVEGLELFKKQTPRAVVLDLKLPRLSGKELCRAFKAHMPSVPIVVLSGRRRLRDEAFQPARVAGAGETSNAPKRGTNERRLECCGSRNGSRNARVQRRAD
jgi:CheY-like chemotaxis protein